MTSSDHHVAVVGTAVRLPGASTLEEYRTLLRSGRTATTVLDEDRLEAAGVPRWLRRRPGYVPVAGLLPDPTAVDAAALGLSETEAELMDPQQRLLLECVVEALEAAGHAAGERGGPVGVFCGQSLPAHLLDNLSGRFHPRGGTDPVDSLHLHGLNVADYLPARVAWLLGLTGPTVAVGATCATSLVALHTAVASLLAHECDTAVAGGVTLRLPQEQGYLSVPDGPFSTDGRTRSYGAGATGTVFTQGAGAVVLRRLADALADGDPVVAVVLGSAIGNDGPDRAGFTAPSVAGQARVVAEALAVAAVEPRQVGLVEGHGTGTALGDPIEVRALHEVFGPSEEPWCALGSVKSQIGHTDAAAGVAGFVKTVLAVQHGELPATAHAEEPNPALPLGRSAFRLATTAGPWNTPDRVAGVSSFGIGGINAHVVLGAPPVGTAPDVRSSGSERPRLHLLSAADETALDVRRGQVRTALAERDSDPDAVAGTLAHGVRRHRVRQVLLDGDAGPVARADSPPQVLLAFPGGGAQFPAMARSLHADEPEFAAELDRLSARLLALTGADPREVALGDAPADRPGTGLPALFAVELALARTLGRYGLRADVVIGHSVGEYAAAVVAGVLAEDDGCRLVAERSRLMDTLPPGGMVAVSLSPAEASTLLDRHPELDLAVVNGVRSCVLAGPRSALPALQAELDATGVEHRTVGVAVAAHSRQVDPLLDPLARLVSGFGARTPTTRLVSTVDGRTRTAAVEPEHWVQHLRSTVRLDLALATATAGAEPGGTLLIQPGPGHSLLTAEGQAVVDRVPTMPRREDATRPGSGRRALLDALGRAWTHGVEIDLGRLAPRTRTVVLPGYPWQRRPALRPHRLGVEAGTAEISDAVTPSAAEPLQLPSWQRTGPLPGPAPSGLRVLVEADGPHGAALLAALGAAGAEVVEDDSWTAVVVLSAATDAGRLASELGRWGALSRRLTGRESTRLLQVTVGAEEVDGGETVQPAATAATGVPRVLAQERPGTVWRTLDLDPRRPDWSAVAAELGLLHRLDETEVAREQHLARRGRHRWVRRWRPWQPEPTAPVAERPRVWVVTGGFGEVGLALAERLRTGDDAPAVVLAGRSVPDDGPRGNRWQRLREAGVEAHQLDVAEPGALRQLLLDVAGRHGRVDVVVHAPVVVDLAPLAELDDAAVEAALRPKVHGALELVRAVDALPDPPRVVLMSSVAGTIGGFGLGAYVAAGRFLDGLASVRGWLAVDWDRIRTGSVEEAGRAAEVSLRHALELEEVLTTLLRLVDLPLQGQVAVSPSELESRSRHLDTRRSAGAPAGSGTGTLTGTAAAVAAVWSDVLGRPVLSPEDDFFALGGHSLLATRVLATLRDRHGVGLRLRDLLGAPTVAGCAALVDAADADGPPAPGQPAPHQPPAPAAAPDRFGLTRVQHAYWIGRTRGMDPSRSGEPGVGCHFFLEYDAAGLDPERYQRAWQRVVERHPMLRTVITRAGEHRLLDPVPELELAVHDLSGLDPAKAAEEHARVRERVSTRVADPARWPLVQPHLVLLPPDAPGGSPGCHVLLSVDVLVCDSASWLLLDRELRRLYTDSSEPPTPALTFADCLVELERRRDPDARQRAERYWDDRLPTLPAAPDLGAGVSPGRPRFTRLSATVPAATWRSWREAAAAHRLTPTALVLTRYRQALARWSGEQRFTLTLTVFDRPDVAGAQDVVGEFSSLVLHEAAAEELAAPLWEHAAATQRRLLDDLDHRELTGLEVLNRWSRVRGASTNAPVVFTSMLGLDQRAGEEPHDHEWLGPQVAGVSQTPQVELDHQAFEHRGALVLQWDVCDSALDLATAQRHFADYVASFTDPAADEPAASVRELLVSVWADLLGAEPEEIGTHSFLALGGDSLLAVRMAAEVRRRTGAVLPLAEIRADLTVDELAALVGEATAGAEDAPALTRRPDPWAPFPLLPLQQAYFVGQDGDWALSYDTAHVSTDVAINPPAGTDAETLRAAVQHAADVVAEHQPVLRAQVLPDGTQRLRRPDEPQGRTAVEVHDLRKHPDPVDALAGLRRHWARTGPDPRVGPGVRLGVVLLPGGRGRLHVATSLLLVDGWSAGLYDRALLTQLAEPHSRPAPLAADFGDYVTAVTGPGNADGRETDLRWWTDRLDDLPAAPRLRRRPTTPLAPVEEMTMREVRLDAGTWARLRQRCGEAGSTASTALLTVFAATLQEVTGQSALLLNSLQHNRAPVHDDVDQMIGAFSRTALLPLRLGDGADEPLSLAELVAEVGRQVAEHGAHHRVSAVEVGRELGRRTGRSVSLAPVVFQSTLGRDAALGGELPAEAGPLGHLDIRDYHQHLRTPQVELELRVFELAGELVLSMAAVDEVLAEGLPAHLLERVRQRTETLLEPAGWDASVDADPDPRWLPRADEQPAAAPVPVDPDPTMEVAPDRVAAVAAVWQQLLGLPRPPAAEEDFFALGGDSLLAVRMVAALRGGAGATIRPRDLLQHPTPAGLAAAARWPDLSGSLLELRAGTGRPVFWLHPSGGDVLCYVELARLLRTDRPVLAVADPGLDGYEVPAAVPELLAVYHRLLRERQPDGPLTLGGWSMGGTLAHALAVRARAAGERVDGVVMVDSNSPERIVALTGLDADRSADTLRLRHLRSVEAFLGLDLGPQQDWRTLAAALVEHGAAASSDALMARHHVFARHLRGLADHSASVLADDVPVLLVRADHRSPRNSGVGMGVDDTGEDDLGWREWVRGPLRLTGVGAHHYSVLRQPAVGQVAEHVDVFLDQINHRGAAEIRTGTTNTGGGA